MTISVAQAARALDAGKRRQAELDSQQYIVVSTGKTDGITRFLHIPRSRREPVAWCRIRKNATLFPTWRRAHNAAKKHCGLTSPARSYPE